MKAEPVAIPYFTGTQVLNWFRDAVGQRNFPIPSQQQCNDLAAQLRHAFMIIGTPKSSGPLSANGALYGRRFLLEMEKAEASLQKIRDMPNTPTEPFDIKLGEMQLARLYVGRVLELAEMNHTGDWDWQQAAIDIWLLASDTWGVAGRIPQSLNENDPMCVFVHAVLMEARIGASEEKQGISASRVAAVLTAAKARWKSPSP
jgi:hypothetical protein